MDPFYLNYTGIEVQALLDLLNGLMYIGATEPTDKLFWIDTSEE